MKNAATLALIMARIDRDKPLLAGEKKLVREALESLAELTDMVNEQCQCSTESVPSLKLCLGSCSHCGDHWVTAARAERVSDCPYTFSHTKHWCGYEGCRES